MILLSRRLISVAFDRIIEKKILEAIKLSLLTDATRRSRLKA